jgi:hypothetical protein
VTQDALLTALQAHPAGALTDTLPVPPRESNDALDGDIENAHGGAVPS